MGLLVWLDAAMVFFIFGWICCLLLELLTAVVLVLRRVTLSRLVVLLLISAALELNHRAPLHSALSLHRSAAACVGVVAIRDAGCSARMWPGYLRDERVLFYLYNQNIKRLAWLAETTVRGLRGRLL